MWPGGWPVHGDRGGGDDEPGLVGGIRTPWGDSPAATPAFGTPSGSARNLLARWSAMPTGRKAKNWKSRTRPRPCVCNSTRYFPGRAPLVANTPFSHHEQARTLGVPCAGSWNIQFPDPSITQNGTDAGTPDTSTCDVHHTEPIWMLLTCLRIRRPARKHPLRDFRPQRRISGGAEFITLGHQGQRAAIRRDSGNPPSPRRPRSPPSRRKRRSNSIPHSDACVFRHETNPIARG